MRLARRTLIGLAGSVLLAPSAFAHRAQSVLTTVEWNAANRTIEVIHRFHTQDAELALTQIASEAVDLTQLRSQARLLIYVQTNFALLDGAQPMELEPIGVELNGEDAIVYREARRPAPSDEIGVDDRLLRDVFDQQTNLVNVQMTHGRVRTLIFAGRDGVKRARGLL
jgi:hypothetical protein